MRIRVRCNRKDCSFYEIGWRNASHHTSTLKGEWNSGQTDNDERREIGVHEYSWQERNAYALNYLFGDLNTLFESELGHSEGDNTLDRNLNSSLLMIDRDSVAFGSD